jgi:hypothetical protein
MHEYRNPALFVGSTFLICTVSCMEYIPFNKAEDLTCMRKNSGVLVVMFNPDPVKTFFVLILCIYRHCSIARF